MSGINWNNIEAAARELAGNWKKFTCFAWHRGYDLEDADQWAIVYTSGRDSGLLAQSNHDEIAERLEPFTEGDDPDVVAESHSHWAGDEDSPWTEGVKIQSLPRGWTPGKGLTALNTPHCFRCTNHHNEEKSMFETSNDFTADQFTATQWEGADQKAKFARQFIAFVESDFAKDKFPLWFYKRLSMTFGHIAHFNQGGFYETFFTSTGDKVKFLRQTLRHTCCGDTAWTYSDVERGLQKWLLQSCVLFRYENLLAHEQETAERADLARLQGKYGVKS